MTHTSCQRRDCLNYFVKRERMTEANEIFCLAMIATPRANCERYVPPSWKPFYRQNSEKKGAR